jgi:hypothetical protein
MKHIELATEKVSSIFNDVAAILAALPVGGKVTQKDIQNQLAEKYGIPSLQVYNVVQFILPYPGIKVQRGKNGGLVKLFDVDDVSEHDGKTFEEEVIEESDKQYDELFNSSDDFADKMQPIINT